MPGWNPGVERSKCNPTSCQFVGNGGYHSLIRICIAAGADWSAEHVPCRVRPTAEYERQSERARINGHHLQVGSQPQES
jgi:hypothetical protein